MKLQNLVATWHGSHSSGMMGKLRISPVWRSARHFSRKGRMSLWEKHSTPPLMERRSIKTMTKTPQSWPLHAQTHEQFVIEVKKDVEIVGFVAVKCKYESQEHNNQSVMKETNFV